MQAANKNLPPVWHTKDGTPVLIREMADSHLLNSLRLILRKDGVRMLNAAVSATQEATSEAEVDRYFTPLGQMELWEKANPTFGALMAEARRRRYPARVIYREMGIST